MFKLEHEFDHLILIDDTSFNKSVTTLNSISLIDLFRAFDILLSQITYLKNFNYSKF